MTTWVQRVTLCGGGELDPHKGKIVVLQGAGEFVLPSSSPLGHIYPLLRICQICKSLNFFFDTKS